MTKISELQSRRHALQDIEAILNAMKNLALVEISKISRFYLHQQEVLRTVEGTLADFEQFYGVVPSPATTAGAPLNVLIGSERGFCGAFNEVVLKKLEAEAIPPAEVRLILIGRKLTLKFIEDKRVVASLDGPSAVEEIPLVISELARTLTQYPESQWKIIHNSYSSEGSRVEITSPFEFTARKEHLPFPFAPLINLPPPELRPQLFEQYLFALFYGVFYLSFLAENHERLRHMEGALNKLKEEGQRLRQLSNSLRQEAITEELEVILLSVEEPNWGSLRK